jgi:acetyl-CoA carboxylase biotin carboxyl carrier protein
MEVAILESMKMQLPVQSDKAGKVKEVKVNSGDFVNEGDLLLVLD